MAIASDELMRLQRPTDELILGELQHSRNLGANIADDIGRHQKTVTKRLNQLEDYGLVSNVGRGLYEITDAGLVALAHIDEYDHDTGRLEEIIEREVADE